MTGAICYLEHLVYAVGGVLFAAAFDPRAPTAVIGVPVIEGVRATTSGGAQVSVSETGSLLDAPAPAAGASRQRDLALLDLKGGASPLKLPPAPYSIRACPDGTRVAFNSDTGTVAIVWIYGSVGHDGDAPSDAHRPQPLSRVVSRRPTRRLPVGS